MESSSNAFCTSDNAAQSLEYVNQWLVSFGDSAVELDGLSVERQVTVINGLFGLLKHRQEEQQMRSEMDERLQKQQVEVETATMRLGRTEKRAIEAERDVDMLRSRLSTTEGTLRTTATQLKETRAELQKTNIKSQSRANQYLVDSRKKELAYNKLQERLAKSMADRARDAKTSIKVLNALKPVKMSSATQSSALSRATSEPEDEATRLIIAGYEEREKELMNENAELRQTLLVIQRQMDHAINPGTSSSAAAGAAATTGSGDEDTLAYDDSDLPKDEFEVKLLKLPYDLVKGNVQQNAINLVQQLQCQIEILRVELSDREGQLAQSQELVPKVTAGELANKATIKELESKLAANETTQKLLESEIASLQSQFAEQQDIINEQERLLQLALEDNAEIAAAKASNHLDDSFHTESGFEVTSQDLAKQRADLQKQAAKLEAERQALTEAAIELGRERDRLQQDRNSADAARRQAETEKLFAQIPPTPEWLRTQSSSSSSAAGGNVPLSARKPGFAPITPNVTLAGSLKAAPAATISSSAAASSVTQQPTQLRFDDDSTDSPSEPQNKTKEPLALKSSSALNVTDVNAPPSKAISANANVLGLDNDLDDEANHPVFGGSLTSSISMDQLNDEMDFLLNKEEPIHHELVDDIDL